jgi:hypothetical protein
VRPVTDAGLADVRVEVRALWESIGWYADNMARPPASELERCMAVCGTLRTRLTGEDGQVFVLVGQLESLARDPDPLWSTVIAIASTLADLDSALAGVQR